MQDPGQAHPAWQGPAQGLAQHGQGWGSTQQGQNWQGLTQQGPTQQGQGWQGPTQRDPTQQGPTQQGQGWQGPTWQWVVPVLHCLTAFTHQIRSMSKAQALGPHHQSKM